MLRAFEREIAEQNWVAAQEGVDVKLVPSPDGEETFLLARSVDRRSKELAMHEKFIAHLEAGLTKLRAAAKAGRLRNETLAGERLGRLKERFWRASQAFDVTIRKLPKAIGRQQLEVSWVRNEKFHEWSQLVDGCYLLRTNLTGVDPVTLWRLYIHLTEVESVGGIHTNVRLRHVTEPEAEQKTLLQRLGLQLPRRLKRIDRPAQM